MYFSGAGKSGLSLYPMPVWWCSVGSLPMRVGIFGTWVRVSSLVVVVPVSLPPSV